MKKTECSPSPLKKNKFIILQKVDINIKIALTTEDFKWHKLLGKGSFGEVYTLFTNLQISSIDA